MYGKILKVSNNDLKGNVDDRQAAVYAAFKHNKYMNRYVVFSFVGEYYNNKLYVGSVHLKEKSLVVFSVRNEELEYINKFVTDCMNNAINPNEYEVLDITNMEKIELVSSNEEDFTGLEALDKMTIKREEVVIQEDNKPKKPILLYTLLVLCVLLLVGVTYLYLNPELLDVDLKELTCTMEGYDKKVDLKYTSSAVVKFDRHDKLASYNREDTYKFDKLDEYVEFKNKDNDNKDFATAAEHKYNDDKLELKLIYNEHLATDAYDEIYNYLKSKGFSCVEGIYHEE